MKRRTSLAVLAAVAGALGLVLAGGPAPAASQAAADGPGAVQGLAPGASPTSLGDFAWLEGTWRGPGPDGTTAEIHFMEPSAGALPAAFRLAKDGELVLLEFMNLAEAEDGIHMYLRHFSASLVPMEEEGAIDLRLREGDGDRFVFENVRDGNPTVSVMSRTGPHAFVAMSELARADGTADTIRVEYRRLR